MLLRFAGGASVTQPGKPGTPQFITPAQAQPCAGEAVIDFERDPRVTRYLLEKQVEVDGAWVTVFDGVAPPEGGFNETVEAITTYKITAFIGELSASETLIATASPAPPYLEAYLTDSLNDIHAIAQPAMVAQETVLEVSADGGATWFGQQTSQGGAAVTFSQADAPAGDYIFRAKSSCDGCWSQYATTNLTVLSAVPAPTITVQLSDNCNDIQPRILSSNVGIGLLDSTVIWYQHDNEAWNFLINNFETMANMANGTWRFKAKNTDIHGTVSPWSAIETVVINVPAAGTFLRYRCDGYDLYHVFTDGDCGEYETFIEPMSPSCGCNQDQQTFNVGDGIHLTQPQLNERQRFGQPPVHFSGQITFPITSDWLVLSRKVFLSIPYSIDFVAQPLHLLVELTVVSTYYRSADDNFVVAYENDVDLSEEYPYPHYEFGQAVSIYGEVIAIQCI